jgi:hypothetical protein
VLRVQCLREHPQQLDSNIRHVDAGRQISAVAASNRKSPVLLGLGFKEQFAGAVLESVLPPLIQRDPKSCRARIKSMFTNLEDGPAARAPSASATIAGGASFNELSERHLASHHACPVARDVIEHRDRGGVRPMQIINHDYQGREAGSGNEELPHYVKNSLAFLIYVRWSSFRCIRQETAEARHDAQVTSANRRRRKLAVRHRQANQPAERTSMPSEVFCQ